MPPRLAANVFLGGEVCFVAELDDAVHGPARDCRAGYPIEPDRPRGRNPAAAGPVPCPSPLAADGFRSRALPAVRARSGLNGYPAKSVDRLFRPKTAIVPPNIPGPNTGRRIGDVEPLQAEISAWATDVNSRQRGVDWQMKIDDALRKLKSIYPKILN